ncbi:hypothetical protein [Streptacidiphilus albus]|uniref:hypothetical protein n=1 Tax=Streptacidiphilus albus TaxID=105425 RepID=UPI000A55FC89|nr:hypothetical protein [Streptacidiphilus albus]
MSTEHMNPPAPTATPSPQPPTKSRWLPEASTRVGAVMYAFLGALLLWAGGALVQHVHIYWR